MISFEPVISSWIDVWQSPKHAFAKQPSSGYQVISRISGFFDNYDRLYHGNIDLLTLLQTQ